MTTKTISTLTVLTLIILSVGCITVDDPVKDITPEIINVTPTPEPTPTATPIPEPTIIVTAIPEPELIDISALIRYDSDKNGIIDNTEVEVIETDYLHKLLTNSQIKCAKSLPNFDPYRSGNPDDISSYTTLKTIMDGNIEITTHEGIIVFNNSNEDPEILTTPYTLSDWEKEFSCIEMIDGWNHGSYTKVEIWDNHQYENDIDSITAVASFKVTYHDGYLIGDITVIKTRY